MTPEQARMVARLFDEIADQDEYIDYDFNFEMYDSGAITIANDCGYELFELSFPKVYPDGKVVWVGTCNWTQNQEYEFENKYDADFIQLLFLNIALDEENDELALTKGYDFNAAQLETLNNFLCGCLCNEGWMEATHYSGLHQWIKGMIETGVYVDFEGEKQNG